MAIIPTAGIAFARIVAATLGHPVTYDDGALCTHPNINKWSRYKPIRHSKVTGLTDEDIISAGCGLDRNVQTQEIFYRAPRGGGYNEPYRIGDFRGYNHLAVPPVNVEIVKVIIFPSGAIIPGPPYTLVIGNAYNIDFRLIPGDIDPLWINPQTSRVKNTNPTGGYGGVAWVLSQNNAEKTIPSNEVFSCESPTPPILTVSVVAQQGELRMQYVRYEGNGIGTYKTTPHYIEDNGYSSSYRSQFLIRNVDAGINASTAFALSYLLSRLDVRIGLVNNESFPLNVKIRMSYKRLETGNEYTYNGNTLELAAGYNGTIFVGPLNGWSVGMNTFEIRAWMYIVRPDLTEVEISYKTGTASINITTGD